MMLKISVALEYLLRIEFVDLPLMKHKQFDSIPGIESSLSRGFATM